MHEIWNTDARNSKHERLVCQDRLKLILPDSGKSKIPNIPPLSDIDFHDLGLA